MVMKAIVVDDSRAMRMILKKTLKGFSFEVVEAGHGKEALACLQDSDVPALALVDWNMPEMNGLDLVKALRADERYNKMSIVMVTTESEMEQMAKALEAGANEYVMKPFSKETIQEKLHLLGLA